MRVYVALFWALVTHAVLGTVVWSAWGHVMPQVFGLPEITWWQGTCLCLVSSSLLWGGRLAGAAAQP